MKRPDTAWQRAELAELFTTFVRGGIPLAQEQLGLILRIVRRLVPKARTVLDLGCGDGVLGRMLLSEYPQARCAFLDFSQPMLDLARKAIAKDGQEHRSQLLLADLGDAAWTSAVNALRPFDLVLSGFCIHHQPDRQKRRIYRQVFELLKPGGLFLNLEHVAATSQWAHSLSEELMIDSLYAHQQRLGKRMSREAVADEWVHRADKQANVLTDVDAQCAWLREVGFADVDCFFKALELALFGGLKPVERSQ
jgi:cyclopropane fatty-acyl-phospholipid synthase-like methyltransferase